MNAKTTMLLIGSMLFASPLFAQDASFEDLVAQSGLSKQEVRMLVGAHTPYPAYRTGFQRTRKQLIETIGKARYEELVQAYERETGKSVASHG